MMVMKAAAYVFMIFGLNTSVLEPGTVIYPATGIVCDIASETNEVRVVDANGDEWAYEDPDASELEAGDVISMIMDTNGTPETDDDTILYAIYSGPIKSPRK